MSVTARLEPRQLAGNRRYAPRRSLRLGSVLADSGAEVIIHDLSVTGFLIETSGELSIGERLSVHIPERGPTAATVVRNSGRLFGCEFESRISVAAVSAALLQYPAVRPQVPSEVEDALIPDTPFHDSAYDGADTDKYSLRTRMLLILGLSAVSWALIAWLAVWLI